MKLKYNFVTREVAGQSVAIVVGENTKKFNGMIKLNGSGEFIFKMLGKDVTEDDMVAAFLSEYETTEEQARNTVRKFISELEKNGLLVK